jgi:hypothetical protein
MKKSDYGVYGMYIYRYHFASFPRISFLCGEDSDVVMRQKWPTTQKI